VVALLLASSLSRWLMLMLIDVDVFESGVVVEPVVVLLLASSLSRWLMLMLIDVDVFDAL
jgi:hypothetical protein